MMAFWGGRWICYIYSTQHYTFVLAHVRWHCLPTYLERREMLSTLSIYLLDLRGKEPFLHFTFDWFILLSRETLASKSDDGIRILLRVRLTSHQLSPTSQTLFKDSKVFSVGETKHKTFCNLLQKPKVVSRRQSRLKGLFGKYSWLFFHSFFFFNAD